MKRILVDVNLILDVLLDREPHVRASATVWAHIEARRAEGVLAAHAVTTIHYLIRKQLGSIRAGRIIRSLLGVFGVACVDRSVIEGALKLPAGDFEDAVTAAAADVAGCDLIVTRDPKGFRGSAVQAVTPETAAHIIGNA